MKPLLSESEDNDALRALGRASVQVVHDLKNQLNGLKLYATFLRKRFEKGDRPADELETVNKLIAGLDRAATDLSMIVEFGQPLSLKKQAGIDLEKIMRDIAGSFNARPPVTGALANSIVACSKSNRGARRFGTAPKRYFTCAPSTGALSMAIGSTTKQ